MFYVSSFRTEKKNELGQREFRYYKKLIGHNNKYLAVRTNFYPCTNS